ncbi:hypothetical protein OWR29_39055 [Actinoplanes sp. Pm04-4]|uniref:Sigma-70 family RNA polymerase sigma factor n=1 Tax=Paractinoplanes pyxinae TaxID=2997416 RepID=A0ABT4BEM9_9ACTN|nr:hypothetical protein [Actinoplanes pyxinae]MCY1144030.1 hypothetical protein [Actinoplanes pyxinae]
MDGISRTARRYRRLAPVLQEPAMTTTSTRRTATPPAADLQRMAAARTWPATALDAAQRAFDLLTCPPSPLSFDGRLVDGLPDRLLPLRELKKLLLADGTPRAVRDQVWRELIARRTDPAWVVATVGLALPGLRRAAGRLARGWHGDCSDLDSELLTGFVDRLRTIDVRESRLAGKLIDAGARAARRARDQERDTDVVRVSGTWSVPPRQPWDHPDWVLARAVAAAIITVDEALLIAETRLENVSLAMLADRLGVGVAVAAAWRRKAEQRLAQAIRAGELDGIPLVPAGLGAVLPDDRAGAA